jgi:hypothetical protein|tara:strand:- start:80 stop:190 length:111 start_codon:yes stop_codon:yes gene_type:complete
MTKKTKKLQNKVKTRSKMGKNDQKRLKIPKKHSKLK